MGRIAILAFAIQGVDPAMPEVRGPSAHGQPRETTGIDVPSAARPRILSVQRIWSEAPHNAFTDLVLFGGSLVCAFREGRSHVSADGALRVLVSQDGQAWTSASRIASADTDLRDPRLTVTPEGRLLLAGGAARRAPRGGVTHESRAWLSADGIAWTAGRRVADQNVWLWRTRWHDGVSYGIGYSVDPANRFVRLYRSTDGVSYEVLGLRVRGPLHDDAVRTALSWLDPRAGTLTEFLTLPSGGDTGYPGLAWHEGRLWVSYYSSHEGKTSVYLAQVEIPPRAPDRGDQGPLGGRR
jgi:hypothetical protein